jgi:hypothetical protein
MAQPEINVEFAIEDNLLGIYYTHDNQRELHGEAMKDKSRDIKYKNANGKEMIIIEQVHVSDVQTRQGEDNTTSNVWQILFPRKKDANEAIRVLGLPRMRGPTKVEQKFVVEVDQCFSLEEWIDAICIPGRAEKSKQKKPGRW